MYFSSDLERSTIKAESAHVSSEMGLFSPIVLKTNVKIFVRVIFLIPLIGYHRLWDGEYSAIYVFSLSLYRLIWEQKQRVAMELCLQSSRCPTNRAGPRQQARGGRFPCGVPTLTAGDAGCWIPILLFQSVPSLLRLGAQPFNYSRMGKCLLPDAGFVFYPKEQNPGR